MIPYTEQIKLICYFIIYGLFLGITFDTFKYLIRNYIFVIRCVLEFIYWGIILIITYYYVIKIQNGFINLYTIIFYLFGFISYYLVISQTHLKRIELIKKIYGKYIKKYITCALFPIDIIKGFIKVIRKIKIKKFLNNFKKKA